jgi:hypothetical protein
MLHVTPPDLQDPNHWLQLGRSLPGQSGGNAYPTIEYED